jgi:hypothetical protein
MQNPLSEYRSGLFATHNNLDESFAYLNSMISTMSSSDQQGINVAVRCLINTLADEIDKVYHPSKNMSIGSLVDKYLDDVLAVRVEEIVNERISDAIGEYMSNEFDISDYEDNIDWAYRIESNLDNDMIKESVEEIVKNSLTIEVRVS